MVVLNSSIYQLAGWNHRSAFLLDQIDQILLIAN